MKDRTDGFAGSGQYEHAHPESPRQFAHGVDQEVDHAGGSAADAATSTVQLVADGVKNFIASPISYLTKAISNATKDYAGGQFFDYLKESPVKLLEPIKDRLLGYIPDWVFESLGKARGVASTVKNAVSTVADKAGDGADWLKRKMGLANGGILPYNGQMMYDAGGYIPPGVTSVVNLTGKPEPVFTDDQWKNISSGEGARIDNSIHVDTTVTGSNLTGSDVANEIEWKIKTGRRQGRYSSTRR